MSEATNDSTYHTDDKVYSVDKFTDNGKLAFNLLVETDKEIVAHRKTIAKLEMALRGFNIAISDQLEPDMVLEDEEQTTESEE